MKLTRTFVFIMASALLLTACNRESEQPEVAVTANTNPLLAYVPADTAYVFANLEPVPEAITDAYVKRFQPALDVMSNQISQFQAAYQSGEHESDLGARLAAAVLDELGGSLSRESLEKIGISMNAHHAFYAKGIFPVIRIGLSDAQSLRDAIARIEAKMGYQMPVRELNGTSYWRASEDGMPVAVYIAILDQQLAISVFPVKAENSLLAAFLGQEMPGESMASSNALGILNSEKGYTPYGSGSLDIQKVADEILDPASYTRGLLGDGLNAELDSLDAVCVAELKSMIARAPRMTAGTTKLTANEMAMAYDLDIEGTLATALAALVPDVPSAAEGDHLLSASLAVKVGKLRQFVLDKAMAITASPYQCTNLQELNDQAAQLVTQLNIPMPPMVNNLLGLRVQLNDFDPAQAVRQGDGLLALHVEKPEMFVGMASMLVPGFENLDLANQAEPVKIPAEMTHVDGIDLFALMGKDAIGVAAGEKNVKDLAAFMNAKPQGNGTLFSVSYDIGKQMAAQAAFVKQVNLNMSDERSAVDELNDAVRETYTQMLERSRLEVHLTPAGLRVDSSLTFK